MTLRHLKIFFLVSDLGSMSAAAKELFITQPTVSQSISELERYYGVKLFDRLSNKLYLTEKGKLLLSYSRHLISIFDELEKALKMPKHEGEIKIGASLTIGTVLLPKLITNYAKTYPLVNINSIINNTKDIEELILKNQIDFGIVEGKIHSSDILSFPFMEDKLVFVCGRGHPLYLSSPISLTELNNASFILREQGSGTRELFEIIMLERNVSWKMKWESSSFESIIHAAVNGLGITVISQLLIKNQLKSEDLHIINIYDVELIRKFNLVYHKNKYLTDSVKDFILLCQNL